MAPCACSNKIVITNGTDKLIRRLKFSDQMYGSQNIFCEGTSYPIDKVQLVNQ